MKYPVLWLTCLLALIAATPAMAVNDYLADFRAAYPAAEGTRIDSCTLCHTSVPSRNAYGTAYRNAGNSFSAIANADTDSDGFTNATEIAALTFPGNAADKPAVTTGSLTVTISPAAAVTAGAQWRIATGVYQNSGGTVTGLAAGAVTVQFKPVTGWIAPADIQVTITAGQTATGSGTYTQPTVPNVVGQTQAIASTAITGAGLVVGAITQQFSNTVASGSVISQNPSAGTQVATGSSVALVVSQGTQPATVPNVVGQTQSAATAAINAANLVLGTITQQYSDTIASGNVISQSPAGGTASTAGTSVNLVISQGPQPVPVPNVVGQNQAAATTAITGAGLTLGVTTEQAHATVPLGNVISQNPAAGVQVLPGASVALLISTGPGPVTVPNIVGQTQTAAGTAIIGASLLVGTVTQEHSDTVLSGSVISQTPAGGSVTNAGDAVALVVSSGPAPVTVPNVVGQTQSAAGTAIADAGLVVGTTTQEYSATAPSGSVISQNPAAGTEVAPDTAVDLVVSQGPQPAEGEPTNNISVPDVSGLTADEAEDALEEAGFEVSVIEQHSDAIPEGQTISQDPPAGAEAAAGSTVTLTVSSGPEEAGGCAACSGSKGAFTFGNLGKMLGDLFMGGLSLMTLAVMARRKF